MPTRKTAKMWLTRFFFDTSAVIELLAGNPKYAKYFKAPITITAFNLAEIYWAALSNLKKSDSELICERYSQFVAETSDEVVMKAVEFRSANHKKRPSYASCIGYIYAQENGMRFLTSDKQFKGMPDVEFVE